MIRNIIKGYTQLFKGLLKILALLAVCTVLGFIIVYPLWKFATSKPAEYSLFIICIASIFCALFIFLKIKKYVQAPELNSADKKKRIQHLFLALCRILVVIAGIVFFVFFVMTENRLFGFIVLGLTLVLYGILTFGTKRTQNIST